MTYSLNGVPLHEGLDRTEWRLLRNGTNVQGGITKSLTNVPIPGRPGYRPVESAHTAQTIVLVVRTPWARLDELLALCGEAHTFTRTADSSKEIRVELASALPTSSFPEDEFYDVAISLMAYEGAWRDSTAVVAGPLAITAPSQTFTILDDVSAPIYDMDIFIRGDFGEFVLTDSGGSFLKTVRAWPGTSGTGLLYVGSTGQAFVANEANPWVPVSDASQYIDVSGNGGFRMTPTLNAGDPSDRHVELDLTTLTQTSTALRVRAKRAYRMN